ncbi:MAG: MarC family protein [Deltaproteobacteria bacterium HGW-Deltaproteobacteria-14]|jgi:multiple antibiotic resistance protein|nr:MAG: MarC family protein [Deltaproteobacteria bacterium HGW-Deltaproteobacteria-14]
MSAPELFFAAFVPLFVAVSPLTILPLFLGMTEGLEPAVERQLAWRGVGTGAVVAAIVLLLGKGLFTFLGITVDDLRVAGGIILFMIAIHDIIHSREARKNADADADFGVVPLGVPLIVGPATLTACLVLADAHGQPVVLGALVANLAIVAVLILNARRLRRVMRPAITRAFGKVMSLFLAAIAVSMVRHGLVGLGVVG